MAGTDQDTYSSIEAKVRVILDRQQMLVSRIEALKAENDSLRAEIREQEKSIEQLKVDNEYLTVATSLAAGHKDVEHTRTLLAELVRDIDRCIAELSA